MNARIALVLGLLACACAEAGARERPTPHAATAAALIGEGFAVALGPNDATRPSPAWSTGPGSLRAAMPAGSRPALLRIELPEYANGVVRIERPDVAIGIGVELIDARAVAAHSENALARYSGGGPAGADVLFRASRGALEDFVRFEHAGVNQLHYRVDITRVAGLRLIAGTLEFLDRDGTPRMRVSRPYLRDAAASARWADLSVNGCRFDESSARPRGRALTPPGATSCELVVSWDDDGLQYPIVVDPRWSSTGVLAFGRVFHTATSVTDQGILIVGGRNGAGMPIANTELFDPTTGEWEQREPLNNARYWHTATGLGDALLVVGGVIADSDPVSATEVLPLSTPDAHWLLRPALDLRAPRIHHAATELSDGSVVITGGGDRCPQRLRVTDPMEDLSTCNPALDVPAARFGHTATFSNGRIFVMGGSSTVDLKSPLSSVESYDPADPAQGWREEDPMSVARVGHTAVLLPRIETLTTQLSESILVVGGSLRAELFEPLSRKWHDTGTQVLQMRSNHAAIAVATNLDQSYVLIVGGDHGDITYNTSEIYERSTDAWRAPAPTLEERRQGHTASLLQDGHSVLVVGGTGDAFGQVYDDAEIAVVREAGLSCDDDEQCWSGHCSHHLCCDGACDGACETCVAAEGATRDGICGPATRGTLCGDGEPSSCIEPRTCDGRRRSCAAAKPMDDGASCTVDAGVQGACTAGVCMSDEPQPVQPSIHVSDASLPDDDAGDIEPAHPPSAEPDQTPLSLSCAALPHGEHAAGSGGWLLVAAALTWIGWRRRARVLRAGLLRRALLLASIALIASCGLEGDDDEDAPPDRDGAVVGGHGGSTGNAGAPDDAGQLCTAVERERLEVTWHQVTLAALNSPGKRRFHDLAASPSGALLFGGSRESGPLADTWQWDGKHSVWSQAEVTGPPARGAHALAYASQLGDVVLFGGAGVDGQLNDTWLWNGIQWRDPCASDDATPCELAPAPRTGHRMAYDAERDAVVLFGGAEAGMSLGDTWAWSVTQGWRPLCGVDAMVGTAAGTPCGPAPRFDHAMTYDAADRAVLLYGGTDGSQLFDDVWQLTDHGWKQLADPRAKGPGARFGHALSYDPGSETALLFGGNGPDGPSANEVWGFAPSTGWIRATASGDPPRVLGHELLAYDEPSQSLVLYAGAIDGESEQTWTLSSARFRGDACLDGGLIGDSGNPSDLDAGAEDDGGPATAVPIPECQGLARCCDALSDESADMCRNDVALADRELCGLGEVACEMVRNDDSAGSCLELVACCGGLIGGLRASCLATVKMGFACESFLSGGFCNGH